MCLGASCSNSDRTGILYLDYLDTIDMGVYFITELQIISQEQSVLEMMESHHYII